MPLKLNVGICKKIGQPDYGSLGASCNVEVELDQSLVFDDLEGFQERVTNAYTACRQAVEVELARHQNSSNEQSATSAGASRSPSKQANGQNGHPASQKQLDYAQQLAGQIRGLGVRKLESLSEKMFDKSLTNLSSLDASGLIDALKDLKAGKIDLKAVLNGATA